MQALQQVVLQGFRVLGTAGLSAAVAFVGVQATLHMRRANDDELQAWIPGCSERIRQSEQLFDSITELHSAMFGTPGSITIMHPTQHSAFQLLMHALHNMLECVDAVYQARQSGQSVDVDTFQVLLQHHAYVCKVLRHLVVETGVSTYPEGASPWDHEGTIGNWNGVPVPINSTAANAIYRIMEFTKALAYNSRLDFSVHVQNMASKESLAVLLRTVKQDLGIN